MMVDTKVEDAVDTNKQTLLDRLLSSRSTQAWVKEKLSPSNDLHRQTVGAELLSCA
jgi:hypothetical protein